MRFGQVAAILTLAGLSGLSSSSAAPAPTTSPRSDQAPAAASPQEQPQSAPARPAGPRPRRPRGAPVRDPKALELLRSMLDANGGEEHLRSIQSLFVRSRLIRGEGEERVESLVTQYWKAPNRYRREVDSPAGLHVMSYNGRYAWNDFGQGVTLAPKRWYADIEDIVRDMNEPLSHLDEVNWLQLEGEQELDGRRVDVVRVTRPSGKIKRLFVDRETRQTLQKEVAQFEDPEHVVARRRFFDYRRVERIWVPFLERDLTADRPSRMEIVDFIPNQAIDDRLFDSPAPPLDESPPGR